LVFWEQQVADEQTFGARRPSLYDRPREQPDRTNRVAWARFPTFE
jgi:hypothetical protein